VAPSCAVSNRAGARFNPIFILSLCAVSPFRLDLEARWTGEVGVSSHSSFLAGHHDQVLFDAVAGPFFPNRVSLDAHNVTQCELHAPIYDRKLILETIKLRLPNNNWLFYSQIVNKHGICPAVATSDGARFTIIQELFAGDCISNLGGKCKLLVKEESWPQAVIGNENRRVCRSGQGSKKKTTKGCIA
jgi:hypothetical protein